MNATNKENPLTYKDAIFLSPHKFIGGPGSPGVLVLKRRLVTNTIPTQPGGGTVDFVSSQDVIYSESVEHREEGGTPAIIESIRCGLVFQLKDTVGAKTIHETEQSMVRRAISTWSANPAIHILGNPDVERVSIVSFMIRHGLGFLHYNFIVALLNDLFGIQARGGCSCAGPYAGVLFGLRAQSGKAFIERVEEGWFSLKPGWTRVSFNYFISNEELQYIISAVNLIALYGWAFLPQYTFEPKNGLWKHSMKSDYQPTKLSSLHLDGKGSHWHSKHETLPESALDEHLKEGKMLLVSAAAQHGELLSAPALPPEFEAVRWFPLPHEVAAYLHNKNR